MSYYVPSGTCTDTGTPVRYTCDTCSNKSFGRVRHVAFVNDAFSFGNDILLFSAWNTGEDNGDIDVIRNVSGAFDGGDTEEIEGFGDVAFDNGNTTFTVTYKDYRVQESRDFYEYIKRTNDLRFYFTDSQNLWSTDTPVNIKVKPIIPAGFKDIVYFEISVKWASGVMPTITDLPASVFDECRIYA